MIIKIYTNGIESEDCHIINDVQDVIVRGYKEKYNVQSTGLTGYGLETEQSEEIAFLDVVFTPMGDTHTPYQYIYVKPIDCVQNGVRKRLLIANRAYVCNDEGKTIEKVTV